MPATSEAISDNSRRLLPWQGQLAIAEHAEHTTPMLAQSIPALLDRNMEQR
jgi:hypothetical protein